MPRYVQVQYVGTIAPRFDNIIPRSGRVWDKPGAALPIPEDEAFHYLAHDQVFRRVGFEAVEHELVQNANDPATLEMLCGYLGLLSKDGLRKVIEAAHGYLGEPEDAPSEPVTDLSDTAAVKLTEKRVRRIFQTLDALPINNENYDARTGKPILAVVQRHCSEKNITQRELDAAVILKKRSAP